MRQFFTLIKMKLLFLVAGAIVGVIVAQPASWKKPSFCRDNECPQYTVPNKFENFEERCYPKTTWIKTTKGFMTLYGYIRAKRIKMTAPVLTESNLNAAKDNIVDSQMHFYIPQNQVSKLVELPSDVTVVEYEARCVYVLAFGGRIKLASTVVDRTKELKSYIENEGLAVKEGVLNLFGYDSPYVPDDQRHNEVMVVKKE